MKSSRSASKFFSWYYLIIFSTVIILGVAASVITYKQVAKNTEESLLENTASVASIFETNDIVKLAGDESDLTNPAYISLKERIAKIPEINTDVQFVYLWGYRDDNVFFFVDSEPTESEDYSPPGQIYDEATELDKEVLTERSGRAIEISTDRWGTWLTALTPIQDAETNIVIAVLGMDMSADRYFWTIYIYTAIPVLTTIFVLILIFISFILQKREEEFLTFKSELVSIASHEIRSPLTGISWLSDTLIKGGANMTERQNADVRTIKGKSEELLSTINDLLDSAAAEKTDKKKLSKDTIPAKKMFEEIIKNSFLSMQEKKIVVSVDPSIREDLNIIGDHDRITRMFTNLVSNAIKYSKEGGRVVIGVRVDPSKNIYWVKDEGIGIPASDQNRIFKGFFRAPNAKEVTKNGTGLGLLYVKQIAELHNGKVWCESTEDAGSTFYVEL